MYIRLAALLIAWAPPSFAFTENNDVVRACASAQVGVPQLSYRERERNLAQLRAFNFGSSDEARALRDFYRKPVAEADEATLVEASDDLNRRFAGSSDLSTLALKYSSRGRREVDPEGFVAAVKRMAFKYLPVEFDTMDWFTTLRDPRVVSGIRLASHEDLDDVTGAAEHLAKRNDGKFDLSIRLSSRASEPLPYVLPLLAHEIEHARTYAAQIANYNRPQASAEEKIVNEALAFDVEMRSYVAMARKDPHQFCDWMYVSWARGDLLVPLSANMAAKLEELGRGDFVFRYAQEGAYAKFPALLNAEKTALRADLQKQISDLHLHYVR